MDENNKKETLPRLKTDGVKWQPAIKIFGQVSTWIVAPVVLASVFGKILDRHYGTKPWIFLGLTAVAFIISIFGIWKVLVKYINEINKNGKSNGPK